MRGEETVETDLADLAAVPEHTAATRVFGHSGGAFVALRAALTLPISQLAVCDPGVAIEGTDSAQGLPRRLPARSTPSSALSTPATRDRDAHHRAQREPRRAVGHEAPAAAAYAGIQARTLLATGSDSSRYFARTCDALAAAMPRARRATIPRARHNPPNLAPQRFIEPLTHFFAGAR